MRFRRKPQRRGVALLLAAVLAFASGLFAKETGTLRG